MAADLERERERAQTAERAAAAAQEAAEAAAREARERDRERGGDDTDDHHDDDEPPAPRVGPRPDRRPAAPESTGSGGVAVAIPAARRARGRITAAPRRGPATRRADSRWLPSERLVGVLLLVVALTTGALLLFGALSSVFDVAP